MAKQDLYKTAQQSAKLFKLIQDEQLLESWVKNKIISAAEDISTVYQYLNYEKQFQDYSKMISESNNLSDSKRSLLEGKLAEAKEKVKELKKKAAKDKSEKMDEDKEMKVGDTKKTRTGELTKTSTGVIHKNTSYKDDGDEIASNAKSGKGIKSHAKGMSAAEKKEQAPKQKQSPKSAKTWGMKDNEKFDNRDKVDEASMTKAGKGVMKYGKDGMQALAKAGKAGKSLEPVKAKYNKYDEGKTCNESPKGKACAVHGLKECGTMEEGKLPMKKVGGKSVPAFAADGKGKNDLAKSKSKDGVKEAISRAKDMLEGKAKKKDKIDMEGNAFGKAVSDAKKDGIQKGEKVKVGGKDIPLKESADFSRMKELMTRLNG